MYADIEECSYQTAKTTSALQIRQRSKIREHEPSVCLLACTTWEAAQACSNGGVNGLEPE